MIGLVDKLRNYAENHALNDGEKILAQDAADEMERLVRENQRLEGFIAMWRKHSYELGKMIDAGQPTRMP